jgi:FkbH-like protein
MMHRSGLSNLPWLPIVTPGFQDQCRLPGLGAAGFRRLAGYALDDNGLNRLHKALVRERRNHSEGRIPGLKPYHLALAGNGTTKLVTPSLSATGLRYGLDLVVTEGEYDQAFQEATRHDSKIRMAQPDGILIAFDWRGLPGLGLYLDEEGEEESARQAISHLRVILRGFREQMNPSLFVQNLACPSSAWFGSLDARVSGSQRRRIEAFNRQLNDLLTECDAHLVDIAGLAAAVGYESWFDPKQWHVAKLPFSQELNPLYADHVLRVVGAANGVARKCLVLDLDNTLWGGVIGDDGIDRIALGQGDPLGEAFVAMQETAKGLRRRGIILAVCSKNDDAVARSVFREHPDMILKEEDIAVFQANWQDKASNLQAIAAALKIGTDALVFVDDNPAEREQIRQVLPEVAVPELSEDPSDYPSLVLSGGYFESLSFTDDDRQRADQYRANAERAQLAESSRDMGDYLVSLGMVIRFSNFDETGRSRIAQLTNRSNQFNLTTRRYDDAAISAFAARSDAFTLQVRLSDRFGDNGMISVVICVEEVDAWRIDTWLMSCRVLNRRVEEAVLDVLAVNALGSGIRHLVGHYVPTEKNGMVRDHYRRLGFTPAGNDGEVEVWRLDLTGYLPTDPPMEFFPPDRILERGDR